MKYTAHVILPFLAGAACVYPVLAFGLFRSPRLIPPSIGLELSEQESGSQNLLDKKGAIFGSVLLLITLAVLVGTSTVGVPVWQVTVPPAILMALRDAIHDWRHHRPAIPQQIVVVEEAGPDRYPLAELSPRGKDVYKPSGSSMRQTPDEVQVHEEERNSGPGTQTPSGLESTEPTIGLMSRSLESRVSCIIVTWESRFPTISTIGQRLPISLLPFAFLMFILVQGLSTQGWVEVWAEWWDVWVQKTGTIGAVGGMCFMACILCNVSHQSKAIPRATLTVPWFRSAAPTSVRPFSSPVFSKYGPLTTTSTCAHATGHYTPSPSAPTMARSRLCSPPRSLACFGDKFFIKRGYMFGLDNFFY